MEGMVIQVGMAKIKTSRAGNSAVAAQNRCFMHWMINAYRRKTGRAGWRWALLLTALLIFVGVFSFRLCAQSPSAGIPPAPASSEAAPQPQLPTPSPVPQQPQPPVPPNAPATAGVQQPSTPAQPALPQPQAQPAQQAAQPQPQAASPAQSQSAQPLESPVPGTPVGRRPMAQAPASPQRGGQFSFNFDDADVFSVIQTIFGDVLRVNYVVDPKVKGRVTFRSVAPVPKEDVLPLMEVILRLNGIAVVEESGLFRIVPLADLAREPSPVGFGRDAQKIVLTGKALLQVIPINYMASSEIVKLVTPFLSTSAIVVDVPKINTIIVVDTDANVKRILSLVDIFDSEQQKKKRPQVFVYNVQNGKAKDITALLQQIFLGARAPRCGYAGKYGTHCPGHRPYLCQRGDQFHHGAGHPRRLPGHQGDDREDRHRSPAGHHRGAHRPGQSHGQPLPGCFMGI